MTCKEIQEKTKKGSLLIDVRTDIEYRQARISGARNIPINELPEKLNELDPDKEILVYCRTGSRSGLAETYLRQQGFKAKNIGGINQYLQCVEFRG